MLNLQKRGSVISRYCFLSLRLYLFIYFYTEGKGGRKRGRETCTCGCLSHTHYWGPGPQPRHVLWLGIEPATLWFTGQGSIHWATPARAASFLSLLQRYSLIFGIDALVFFMSCFISRWAKQINMSIIWQLSEQKWILN